jgi:hypothetical protein
MPGRRINPNRAKCLRSYSIRQLADLFGVHKNTVANWQRNGLSPIDGCKPILFQGAVVRRFLAKRNAERKRPCPPGMLFCFRCRVPRPPAHGLIEYVPITPKTGNARAFCSTCETLMHRRVSRSALATKMPGLDVQFPEAPLRLIGKTSASLNCDSGTKAAA